MKFEFIGHVVLEMFENVDGRTDDGHSSHWYTISSPMSLRLRSAKNLNLRYINDQLRESIFNDVITCVKSLSVFMQ